jgi:hypothetical protein
MITILSMRLEWYLRRQLMTEPALIMAMEDKTSARLLTPCGASAKTEMETDAQTAMRSGLESSISLGALSRRM